MTTTTPSHDASETVLSALNWRYATKVFDPKRVIPESDWQVLEESMRLTPSSFGLQPYKFLVITDPNLRAQLRPVSWGQAQITDASHLVVFLARQTMTEAYIDEYLEHIVRARGVKLESLAGYRNMMVSNLVGGPRNIPEWASRQAYIAFGQLMQTAALLGVDACPLEGLDPLAYDRILGIEGGEYRTIAACAFGYRNPEDAYAKLAKVRFPNEHLVIHR